MKKSIIAVIVSLLVLCFTGVAGAIPWTWTDTYSVDSPILLDNSNDWYQYTHSISDNGFDVGEDLVTSANLTIDLYDDGGDWREYTRIQLDFGWGVWDQTLGRYEIDYADLDLGVSIAGLVYLNLTGDLIVEIEQIAGDFYFGGSILTASGEENAPVPEPATMLLLGTGLVGIAGATRKKIFRRS